MTPGITEAVAKACWFHAGQVDKAGKPYILHLLRVALSFEDEELQIIGVLHDILEDTSCVECGLRAAGFSQSVVESVVALTRLEHENYIDYIHRVSKNPDATQVKLADLRDNLDPRRIENPTDEDIARARKYTLAYRYLSDEQDERV